MNGGIRAVLLSSAVMLLVSVAGFAEDVVTRPGESIEKDTVWEGRVAVERTVTIRKGAALSVRPGTVVSFGKGAALSVEGALKAEGSAGAPVRFVPAVDNASPGDWGGIRFAESAGGSVLSRCVVLGAAKVEIFGAGIGIRDCEIGKGKIGVAVHRNSAPTLSGNTFRENDEGVVVVSSGTGLTISGNRFLENRTGLRCENSSSPTIERNEFTGNEDAITCKHLSSPIIRNNAISKNGRGIACSRISAPRIVANDITGNRKGIYLTLSSYAVVNGNNISGNGVQVELDNMSADWERRVGRKPERGAQAQLANLISRGRASRDELAKNRGDRAALADAVDATGNWWGEKDTAEMEAKGPDADIGGLVDRFDVPVRTYEGYPGEYAQDRIRYEGWSRSRIPGAGLPPARAGGVVRGKVNFQGKPLEGAVVHLYSGYDGGFRGQAAYRSEPTRKDGAFEVAPAGGRYFLVARKSFSGKELKAAPGDCHSYYGGNPVVVGEGETIHVGINCAPVIDPGERHRPGGTGIRGKVYADGKPLARARVTLYQDGETIFRGIGYASVLAGSDGEFSFNLEPGTYYVVARKRAGDEKMGPLDGGDFFGFAHDNPVEVTKDRYTVVSVHSVGKLVKVKEGGQEVTLGGTVKAGETVLSGVIRDREGRPVEGVFASAYRDPMMTQKPDFMSRKTGKDGAYAIHLSEGGEYFLGARNTIGGPAEKGELLGRYEGNEDHSVRIRTGEKRNGVDIVVEAVE